MSYHRTYMLTSKHARSVTVSIEVDDSHRVVGTIGSPSFRYVDEPVNVSITLHGASSAFLDRLQAWLAGDSERPDVVPHNALIAGHPALTEGVIEGELIEEDGK